MMMHFSIFHRAPLSQYIHSILVLWIYLFYVRSRTELHHKKYIFIKIQSLKSQRAQFVEFFLSRTHFVESSYYKPNQKKNTNQNANAHKKHLFYHSLAIIALYKRTIVSILYSHRVS